MAEMLDTYNDNLELIGVKDRDAVHRDGDWHRSFHCWVVGQRDGRSYVLFQLRGPDKAVYPDHLDITAAGHLEHGETAEQGIRELKEELGIDARYDDLIHLGLRPEVVLTGNITNREFCDVYLLRDDRDLSEFQLEPEEVTGLVEIPLEDGLRLFAGEVDQIDARSVGSKGRVTTKEVSLNDVIPRKDPYYLKVFVMTERFFDGRPYLAI